MRPFPLPFKRSTLWLVLAMLAFGISAFLGWQHFYPVQVASGWSFRVYRDDIPLVSALVVDQQGHLYVSQEFKDERGVVFRLNPDGTRHNVLTRLTKPDGLSLLGDGIVVSQEAEQCEVLWWRDGNSEPLFVGQNVEGLASDGRTLFAVEDAKRGGRLLKYDPEKKETTTLRGDLEEAEGLTVCPDGTLFYTEKKKGWVKKYQAAGRDEIVARGLNAPSFLMCSSEGIWITEDRTHRARLLLLDASGQVRTVLSHLRAPQTIVAINPARFLVAEQGRGRILELNR